MSPLNKLLQQARRLSAEEQLRLISTLCEELRVQLHPQVVRLEGRWADLPFDEAGMGDALKELHRQSWQHLEEEACE